MPSFQELFEKTSGKPIHYQGKTLVMMDDFLVNKASKIQLVFESCHGEWRQGIALRVDGKFKVNNQNINKGIVLWQDTAPHIVVIEVSPSIATIEVKNVWDVGDGVIRASAHSAQAW